MEISLAGWSLHRRFKASNQPLRLLDYPATTRDEFGIDQVELNSPFFEYANPADPPGSAFRSGYLQELRKRADTAGVRLVGIAVDGHGDLASLDESARRKALENHRKWFDACRELGCAAFRANSGGVKRLPVTAEHVSQCIKSFRQLADWATSAGITVMMENHWGLSADADRMVHIVREVNSPSFRLLADFRNWPPDADPCESLAKLAPYASFVHAKFLKFNKAGEDPDFDTARVMRIFQQAGYRGLFGIEYEGKGDDHDGVCNSIALLQRHAYVV